jgi:hypothetical protein
MPIICIGCEYNAEVYWEDWNGVNGLYYHRRHDIGGKILPGLRPGTVSIPCYAFRQFPEQFKLELVEARLDRKNERRY